MIRKIEAVVDEQGTVRLKETVRLVAPPRAVVTIFDEDKAIKLANSDFKKGLLRVVSYARPGKLFTAS
jgi:hypothetical protein